MEASDRLLKEILEKDPSPDITFLVLSRAKEEGRLQTVIEDGLKALNKYPDDINLRKLLVEAYSEQDMVYEAESELKKIISHVEDLISFYRLQAELLIEQDRKDDAVKSLRLYLAHRPDDREAVDLMESIQPPEVVPEEPEPVADEAAAAEKREKETAKGKDEGLPDIFTATLAEIYYDQGQIDKAVEVYEKVTAGNPEDVKSKERLNEIKAEQAEHKEGEPELEDRQKLKKERMIAVLESWLASIREKSTPPAAAG